jgi:hypothetical protein
MKIQNIRSVTNSNFNIAFEKLALSMLFESTIDDGYYNISLFNVDKKTFRMLIIVCALRYILRSLQYPKIFNEEQQDYRKVISYLSKVYQYE